VQTNVIAIANIHGHGWPCQSVHGCLERFAGAISFRALNFRNWYDGIKCECIKGGRDVYHDRLFANQIGF